MSGCIQCWNKCVSVDKELFEEFESDCTWCGRKVSCTFNDEALINSINAVMALIGSIGMFIAGAMTGHGLYHIGGGGLLLVFVLSVIQNTRKFCQIKPDEELMPIFQKYVDPGLTSTNTLVQVEEI